MSTTFRPTTPADRPALAKLLAEVFGSPPESSLLDPALMSWKYWDPRSDYTEPRSYVLESDGTFIGHVGLWPLEFAGVRGVHMIDWAASRSSPGAGISMVQRVARMFDFICAIGGSETTRKVLPAFGFKEVAHTWEAARPLRPLRQILTHQNRNWKLAARLARNSWWAATPVLRPPGEWGIEEISPARVGLIPETHGFPRPHGFFEYLAGCPTVRFRVFSLTRRGEPMGHLLLSLVQGQARLAGLWLAAPSEDSFGAAYALAQRVGRSVGGACEFVAKGVEGAAERSAISAGLRVVAKAPVFVLDKKGLFAPPPEFQFQLIDDDGAFLDVGRANYLT
jgi:hypothetical protein